MERGLCRERSIYTSCIAQSTQKSSLDKKIHQNTPSDNTILKVKYFVLRSTRETLLRVEDFQSLKKMDCYQQEQIFPFVIRKESTPHIAKQIFLSLNQNDLAKCRLVSSVWKGFIDSHTPLWGRIPTHRYLMAAKEGRLDVCRLIIQSIQDKNPADPSEPNRTLLHWAAE